jgi:hypothetical protein
MTLKLVAVTASIAGLALTVVAAALVGWGIARTRSAAGGRASTSIADDDGLDDDNTSTSVGTTIDDDDGDDGDNTSTSVATTIEDDNDASTSTSFCVPMNCFISDRTRVYKARKSAVRWCMAKEAMAV